MNKENQEWEDRFEFDFLHRSGSCAYNLIAICSAEEQRIKSFIQSELSKAREEERVRIKGILEKMNRCYCGGHIKKINIWHTNECRLNKRAVFDVLTDAIKEIEK